MIPIEREHTVLDIGSGTGYFTIPVSQMTKERVIALDIEPQMIANLKERMEKEGIQNIELLQGVIEELPLSNESVNHVIASFVLHEVTPLSKGLQEIYRVMIAGGYFICLEWEMKEEEKGPSFEPSNPF
jgi:ubiquinone/menaquinone biosynthesis C-methylase UbiE